MNNTKNRSSMMVRLVAVLAVIMMFTMCFVGGTFAKYVTSYSKGDDAGVAKWGVEITGTGDLFQETYASNSSFTGNTVVSMADVVAPGTHGNMAAFDITGTPEVAVNVAFTGNLDLGDKWVDAGGSYYCPIEITVGTDTIKGNDYASASEFEAAVEAKIAAFSKDYAPNKDLSTIDADAPSISWEWTFEGNDDEKDTDLGDQAAAGNAATISLEVTVTVTQID